MGIYEKHGKWHGRWIDCVIVEKEIAENFRESNGRTGRVRHDGHSFIYTSFGLLLSYLIRLFSYVLDTGKTTKPDRGSCRGDCDSPPITLAVLFGVYVLEACSVFRLRAPVGYKNGR